MKMTHLLYYYNVDSDKYCSSRKSSSKESCVAVIKYRICKSIELLNCNNNDSQPYSVFDDRTEPHQMLSLEQHYD